MFTFTLRSVVSRSNIKQEGCFHHPGRGLSPAHHTGPRADLCPKMREIHWYLNTRYLCLNICHFKTLLSDSHRAREHSALPMLRSLCWINEYLQKHAKFHFPCYLTPNEMNRFCFVPGHSLAPGKYFPKEHSGRWNNLRLLKIKATPVFATQTFQLCLRQTFVAWQERVVGRPTSTWNLKLTIDNPCSQHTL